MCIQVLPSRGRHSRRPAPLSGARRWSASGFAVLGFAMMFWAVLGGVSFLQSAHAAPSAVDQCNGIADTPGLEIKCDVSVTNNLDLATGTSSSTVTLSVCQGAANVTPTCATPTTTTSTGLTTSVTQCNGSVLGGGGVVLCTVGVTNNITGNATVTTATVNQCIGSGQGGGTAMACNPTEATTGATITQCNGSGNSGGGNVTCTVTPSTQTSALPVTINQCNGSGDNGGDNTVTCTVSLTNHVIPAVVTSAPGSTTPSTTGPGASASGSGGSGGGSGGGPGGGSGGSSGTAGPGNGSSTHRSGTNTAGTSGPSRSHAPTTVISAPVLAPSLHTSSFTPPAGLTGDSAPQTGHADPLLWGLALGCLTAGLLLIVVRSPQ